MLLIIIEVNKFICEIKGINNVDLFLKEEINILAKDHADLIVD